MSDTRIRTDLPRHHKMRKLEKRLGAEGAWALIKLFLWATETRPSGDLTGMSDEDIELAVDWGGKEGEFVATIANADVKFLEGAPGAYQIHDWDEHNHFVATKPQRQLASRIANDARWNRFKSKSDTERIRHASDSDQNRNPRFASLRSASYKSPLPPKGGQGMAGNADQADDQYDDVDAARVICSDLNISGVKEQREVCEAIKLRQSKTGETPRHISEQMVKRWKDFSAQEREWQYPTPLKFFTGGLWLTPERWPKPKTGKSPPQPRLAADVIREEESR